MFWIMGFGSLKQRVLGAGALGLASLVGFGENGPANSTQPPAENQAVVVREDEQSSPVAKPIIKRVLEEEKREADRKQGNLLAVPVRFASHYSLPEVETADPKFINPVYLMKVAPKDGQQEQLAEAPKPKTLEEPRLLGEDVANSARPVNSVTEDTPIDPIFADGDHPSADRNIADDWGNEPCNFGNSENPPKNSLADGIDSVFKLWERIPTAVLPKPGSTMQIKLEEARSALTEGTADLRRILREQIAEHKANAEQATKANLEAERKAAEARADGAAATGIAQTAAKKATEIGEGITQAAAQENAEIEALLAEEGITKPKKD